MDLEFLLIVISRLVSFLVRLQAANYFCWFRKIANFRLMNRFHLWGFRRKPTLKIGELRNNRSFSFHENMNNFSENETVGFTSKKSVPFKTGRIINQSNLKTLIVNSYLQPPPRASYRLTIACRRLFFDVI